MASALSIASGFLEGRIGRRRDDEERREREQQDQLRNLQVLSGLDDRFKVGDDGTPASPSATEVAQITLGDKRLPVRFDPAQSKKAQKLAANKAAHARLQQNDDAVWGGDFDPDFDYIGAEREERRQKEVEDGLVAEGMPRGRAHLLARNNVDLEKRQHDAEAAAALAAERKSAAAKNATANNEKAQKQLEEEALGFANSLAVAADKKETDGALVARIQSALATQYPKMKQTQRAGIAAKAVQGTRYQDAKTEATQRSNKKGITIGGITIDPDSVAGASGADGGTVPAKGKETRQQLIDRMIREGKSDQEIAAEIQRRGM